MRSNRKILFILLSTTSKCSAWPPPPPQGRRLISIAVAITEIVKTLPDVTNSCVRCYEMAFIPDRIVRHCNVLNNAVIRTFRWRSSWSRRRRRRRRRFWGVFFFSRFFLSRFADNSLRYLTVAEDILLPSCYEVSGPHCGSQCVCLYVCVFECVVRV